MGNQMDSYDILTASRTMWDLVLTPYFLLRRSGRNAKPLSRKRSVALMSLCEVFWPLVPRVCSAIVSDYAQFRGTREQQFHDMHDECVGEHRSSYDPLEWAAEAGGGGRGRCALWLLRRREREAMARGGGRNRGKEQAAVLRGLCMGGHLGAAQSLVGRSRAPGSACGNGDGNANANVNGTGTGIADVNEVGGWMGCGGLCRSLEVDVGESLLRGVCGAGLLEVAKWIVLRFPVHNWQMFLPFLKAIEGGHLDVAQWIEGNFDVRRVQMFYQVFQYAPRSGRLDVMEYCWNRFRCDETHQVIALILLCSRVSAEHYVEQCKWLKEHLNGISWDSLVTWMNNADVKRWMIKSGLALPPDSCYVALYSLCDVKLAKWLMAQYHVPLPEVEDWIFENDEDSVSVVQFILQHPKNAKNLPPAVMRQSIKMALYRGNLAVADWLETTGHCRVTKSLLDDELTRYWRTEVFHWFLERVPNIKEHLVAKAVNYCLLNASPNIGGALILLKTCNLDHHRNLAMWRTVVEALPSVDLSSAQQLSALGHFTREQVARSFATSKSVLSAKVVKWAIESFHLEARQVKANNNSLLFALIVRSKTSCAEYFVRKFNVTLKELLDMFTKRSLGGLSVSLTMWRMLLRQFPGITAEIVKENLMSVVIASPYIMEHSLGTLGLTVADILQYCHGRNVFLPSRVWLEPHQNTHLE
ncbi:hypothetical protein Pelo_4327 [Pelomyxa schiedti]|nr:hypothetical protein Pelo_4327 [Pelomyxa schiedti]